MAKTEPAQTWERLVGVLKSQVTTSKEEPELVSQKKSQGLGKVEASGPDKLARICTSPRDGYESG